MSELDVASLRALARNRQMPDDASLTITLGELRAALAIQPVAEAGEPDTASAPKLDAAVLTQVLAKLEASGELSILDDGDYPEFADLIAENYAAIAAPDHGTRWPEDSTKGHAWSGSHYPGRSKPPGAEGVW